jgi:tetratricopeptide (TPR) repeat protein
MMLGMAESSLGRLEPAVELLERSLALGWSDSAAHYKLGRALVDLGREEEGVRHLKKAVELDSGHTQAVYALMRVMAARNAPEAKEYGRQLRDLQKEQSASGRARVLANAALSAAKEQDWPKAVDQLRKAIETCGECQVRAQLHKNLGLIMAQSGDLEGAASELRIARELNPEDLDTKYALEVLPRLRASPQR